MFGFGKNKKQKKAKPSKESKAKSAAEEKSQRIRAEALANARAARENIGEETIQKIAAAMAKKENNPMEKAKRTLENVDADRVADEILYMLDDK